MKRALLAFDKFKDALGAHEACAIAAEAAQGLHCDLCPLTDGGEGFAEILTQAAGQSLRFAEVTGPRGARVRAGYGCVRLSDIPVAARAHLQLDALPADALLGVLEMAQASGLAMLSTAERDPWQTSSVGTGELMARALADGAQALLIGVGGSATNDLGLGALAALGWQFLDVDGREISPPIPALWEKIERIVPPAGRSVPVRIACDVANPLLGKNGAAAVYGPQKGLRREDHARLEAESTRLSALLCAAAGRDVALREHPGTGAAGGISFGLMAALDAKLLPGFEFVSAWFDLEVRLARAELLLTGEGRFDDSSLSGKGPGAIVRRALDLGKSAYVFAGQVAVSAPPAGLRLQAITPPGTPLPEALRATAQNLRASVGATDFNL